MTYTKKKKYKFVGAVIVRVIMNKVLKCCPYDMYG